MPDLFSPKKSRSPIQSPPPRLPGEGLRAKKLDVLFDHLFFPFTCIFVIGALAAFEWWQYFFPSRPKPWVYTILFAITAIFGFIRMRHGFRHLQNLKLGEDGERTVAQILQDLSDIGYHAVHDIQQPQGNIDHVLIGPAGVFSIETKTRSKPGQGKAEILFDGHALYVKMGQPLDPDPLPQAKACAANVQRLLKQRTGQHVPIQPVLLFPGWFIRNIPGKHPSALSAEVYVMNQKFFAGAIRALPQNKLTKDQIKLYTAQLHMVIAPTP